MSHPGGYFTPDDAVWSGSKPICYDALVKSLTLRPFGFQYSDRGQSFSYYGLSASGVRGTASLTASFGKLFTRRESSFVPTAGSGFPTLNNTALYLTSYDSNFGIRSGGDAFSEDGGSNGEYRGPGFGELPAISQPTGHYTFTRATDTLASPWQPGGWEAGEDLSVTLVVHGATFRVESPTFSGLQSGDLTVTYSEYRPVEQWFEIAAYLFGLTSITEDFPQSVRNARDVDFVFARHTWPTDHTTYGHWSQDYGIFVDYGNLNFVTGGKVLYPISITMTSLITTGIGNHKLVSRILSDDLTYTCTNLAAGCQAFEFNAVSRFDEFSLSGVRTFPYETPGNGLYGLGVGYVDGATFYENLSCPP